MIGPQCQCADLGLMYCEMGDESLCRDTEMRQLEMLETSNDILSAVPTAGTTTNVGRFGKPRRHCIHSLDDYELENGWTVYLSAVVDARLYRDWIPDIGIYLDGSWDMESESFTYLIPWQDYGLPLGNLDVFRRYIVTALEHIDNGETVDIGCMGGHGRTGTFLACLDIASSGGRMTAKRAIKKVRTNHCFQAIETSEQEWFVNCFRAFWRGDPTPKRPTPKHVPKTNTVKRSSDTGAVITTTTTVVTPRDTGKRYCEDYVWEFPDSRNKGQCLAYVNPMTGVRHVKDTETDMWTIDANYVATEREIAE